MSPKLKPLQEGMCWPHTLSHAGQHYLRLVKPHRTLYKAIALAQTRNYKLPTYSAQELVCIFAFLLKLLFAGQVSWAVSETHKQGFIEDFPTVQLEVPRKHIIADLDSVLMKQKTSAGSSTSYSSSVKKLIKLFFLVLFLQLRFIISPILFLS